MSGSQFIELFVGGLAIGCIYSLIALGFTMDHPGDWRCLRRLSSTIRAPWRSVILALGQRSHAARYAARAT
jgi:hypothetical protein